MNAKKWFFRLLEAAGTVPNGPSSDDIQILNPALYRRVRSQGVLGFGDAYIDGWWECPRLDQFIYKVLRTDVRKKLGLSLPVVWGAVKAAFFNLQSVRRAFQVGEKHYDIGNDLFTEMLGPSMAYSCGYWKNASNLVEAQNAKYDLICRKLGFKKGMKVLDIGCGWGGFARYAAQNFGVSVIGLTVSKEQAAYAQELCKGLPVEIRVEDYRKFKGQVDRIVSVGMFEHVGVKNYRNYMKIARSVLVSDGLFLLHTIGSNNSQITTNPWILKHIFPNGMLPSLKQIAGSVENIFVIEDIHNFGADYDLTLMAWHENFEKAWPKLKSKYGERFHRMWNYYLLSCAGSFRARSTQLWQIVLSPKGVEGGYTTVR